MRVPVPLVLQSSTSVACERRSDSVSTELESVYSLTIVAVACPWLWAGSAHSMDFANWSQARGRLPWLAKSSVREMEYSIWQRLLSRRRSFNLRRACTTASHTYVLSKLSGNNTLQYNNKLNNYDVIHIHCTAPSKMKLIYVYSRLKGWGSPELALEMRKKERKNDKWLFFINLFLTCTITLDACFWYQ